MDVWRRVGSVGVLPLVLVMWGCSGEDSPSVSQPAPLATITSGSTLPVTSTSSSTGAAPTLSATTTAPGPAPPSTSVTDPPRSATTVIPTTTTTTLAAPPGLPSPIAQGSIIVAGEEVITVLPDGYSFAFSGAEKATGDGAGGLLVQQGNDLWWLKADGSAPLLLVDGEPLVDPRHPRSVALMEGLLINGVSHALYVLIEWGGDSSFPEVIGHNLMTGETTVYFTNDGYEGGVGHVSYAQGVLSVSHSAEGCTWFDMVTLDGSRLPFGNPFVGGCDRPEFPQIGGGVLAPEGRTMAYLASDDYPDDDVPTDLVLYDLVAEEELARLTLPLGNEWNRIDYDGTRVLVTPLVFVEGRWVYGTAILVDVGVPVATFIELSAEGLAAFTK